MDIEIILIGLISIISGIVMAYNKKIQPKKHYRISPKSELTFLFYI